ncbi:hypothetical protein GCM10010517_01360 [Streptosporangium fragile]|uniref:Uncharacterized protein n=1 Tax=Streptosporangium fragile TaxID=46186 RepID=A0ABN3VPM6_9ACTN
MDKEAWVKNPPVFLQPRTRGCFAVKEHESYATGKDGTRLRTPGPTLRPVMASNVSMPVYTISSWPSR